MNKFLLITKIDLLRTFNLTKNNNLKYKSERRKKSIKALVVTLILGYILWYVYFLTKTLMPTFVTLGKPLYLIAFLFTACSLYIFFANVFKIKNVLFDFKDYDLLMSLPVSRHTIIASKLTSVYIINLLFTIIVMIPGYFAYIQFVDLPNDILFFLLLISVPIIPILLSSIIGIIISYLTSFFKNKNIGSYVVNLSLIFLVLSISFSTNNLNEVQIVNQSINIVDSFSKYYPFTTLFVNLLDNFNILNLCFYFIIPVLFIIIYILFINKGYIYLRTKLLKTNIKSDYEIERYKRQGSLKGLYFKELKKYFSNSLYVINSSFGSIVLIMLILSLLLFNDYMINRFQSILNINESIKANIFLIFSLLCVLSSTTNSSISLEGKNLWIMKMLPVNTDKIFLSKIMVNLTILIPTILIGGTFFGIYLHLPLVDFILIYILPLAYAIFTSLNGLLLNLIFPKLDFDNEIKVIKQSLAVALSIIIDIIMVIVPFTLLKINTSSIILIMCIIILVDIIIAMVLHFYGNRKFRSL